MIILIFLHELVLRWGFVYLAFIADRTVGQAVFLLYPLLEILWYIITLAELYAPDFRKQHVFKIVRNISMIYLIPCFIYSGLLIMLFIASFPGIFE